MDDKTAKQLLFKSTNHIFKKIVIKNFKSFEIIENEVRIIIDLNIIYYQIKNSFGKIIDYVSDRFKIIDKDELTKILILHIYSSRVKECILKINKILSSESNIKEESKSNEFYVKYITDEIMKCIFTDDIIREIIDLSEATEFNLINTLKTNWKKIIIVVLVLILISIIKKGYYFLFKSK